MKIILGICIFAFGAVYFYIRKIYPEIICYKSDFAHLDFVCPNCMFSFRVKWYHCVYGKYTFYTYGKMNLKCPMCKSRDMCRPK